MGHHCDTKRPPTGQGAVLFSSLKHIALLSTGFAIGARWHDQFGEAITEGQSPTAGQWCVEEVQALVLHSAALGPAQLWYTGALSLFYTKPTIAEHLLLGTMDLRCEVKFCTLGLRAGDCTIACYLKLQMWLCSLLGTEFFLVQPLARVVEAKGEIAVVDLLRVAGSTLDIADCGFETLPAEVTCWPRPCLQQLKLSGNRLTDLPEVCLVDLSHSC
jgi:hypothetical protein